VNVDFWFELASTYSYPAAMRIERICAAEGIPFRRPSVFPRNGLLAARVAYRFADAPWCAEFVRRVYRANFAEDLDIAAPGTLARCLEHSGEDPAGLLEEARSPEARAGLRRQTQEATELGIFGAPSFVVAGELFWGNDRLEHALAWGLERAAGPGPREPGG